MAHSRIITASLVMGYSVFRIGQGLLFHPYQTMSSLVDDRAFIWMSLIPTGLLALLTVAWRMVLVPLIGAVLPCSEVPWQSCQWLPILSDWITFFCIYWQILLLYLLFRFRWVHQVVAKK